jgi:signal transduction histidine kinase
MWRMAWFAAAAFLFMTVVFTAGIVLVGTAFGVIHAHPSFRIVAVIVLVALLVLLVRGGTRFRRVAMDLGGFVDGAARIEAGDYGVQVPERGPRELRTLARAFNAMSSRLATTEQNRRSFVADLAHELRTPLAVIRGQAEGIGDGIYPGDQAHVAPILDATQSLESLIAALPTLTMADVGSLRLNREPVDISVLINSTTAAFQAMADAAGVNLKTEIEPNTPAVEADPARIRGVLMNLLSNAIRYTPSGGLVTTSAGHRADQVVIAVRDTGPGIPEDLRSRVFERFVKGPGSPGAGLGLAIAKDVVTAHGGQIEVKSEPGKGTEVRFTLPIQRS